MNKRTNKPQIQEKQSKETMELYDAMNDPYYLDKELKEELKKKGLVPRFVNINRIRELGGRHQKGWTPYKREGASSNTFGSDPDGLVRRGTDLVLAVKPAEEVELHKKMLRIEAERARASNKKKQDFEEMKRRMASENLSAMEFDE